MSITITDRLRWLLVIIKISGYVEGSTRLQKLVFLVSKRVKGLSDMSFYNDWVPGNFGPFSKELAQDVDEAILSKILTKQPVPNKEGFTVDCFALTEDGMRIADEKAKDDSKTKAKIEEIIRYYSKAPLMSLLHDVYFAYPEYASGSKIRADVVGRTGVAGTGLDPTYDESE